MSRFKAVLSALRSSLSGRAIWDGPRDPKPVDHLSFWRQFDAVLSRSSPAFAGTAQGPSVRSAQTPAAFAQSASQRQRDASTYAVAATLPTIGGDMEGPVRIPERFDHDRFPQIPAYANVFFRRYDALLLGDAFSERSLPPSAVSIASEIQAAVLSIKIAIDRVYRANDSLTDFLVSAFRIKQSALDGDVRIVAIRDEQNALVWYGEVDSPYLLRNPTSFTEFFLHQFPGWSRSEVEVQMQVMHQFTADAGLLSLGQRRDLPMPKNKRGARGYWELKNQKTAPFLIDEASLANRNSNIAADATRKGPDTSGERGDLSLLGARIIAVTPRAAKAYERKCDAARVVAAYHGIAKTAFRPADAWRDRIAQIDDPYVEVVLQSLLELALNAVEMFNTRLPEVSFRGDTYRHFIVDQSDSDYFREGSLSLDDDIEFLVEDATFSDFATHSLSFRRTGMARTVLKDAVIGSLKMVACRADHSVLSSIIATRFDVSDSSLEFVTLIDCRFGAVRIVDSNVSGSDLRDMTISHELELYNVVWTDETKWPPRFYSEIIARSVRRADGSYITRTDGKELGAHVGLSI